MIDIKDLEEIDNSISSIGVIRKWYDEKKHHYIKASSLDEKKKKYHLEAVMECIAYEVGKIFGIDVVPYWMDTLHISPSEIIDVCVSEDYKMNPQFQSSISANSFLLKGSSKPLNRKERYEFLTSLSTEIKVGIDKLILFDYLIDNYDRHMRNIEFSKVGADTILSPIFDSGSSLLADYTRDEDLYDLQEDDIQFEEIIRFAQTQSKAFANEHATEIRLVGKEAYAAVNLNIKEEAFGEIVEKYSKYLSPIRKEMIISLLTHRYRNIVTRSKLEETM